MICAHCHSEIADDSMFCTECGAKVEASAASSMLRPSARVCPHCGNDIPADAEFCTMCGARLEAGDDAALTTADGSEPEPVPDPVCPHCGAPLTVRIEGRCLRRLSDRGRNRDARLDL